MRAEKVVPTRPRIPATSVRPRIATTMTTDVMIANVVSARAASRPISREALNARANTATGLTQEPRNDDEHRFGDRRKEGEHRLTFLGGQVTRGHGEQNREHDDLEDVLFRTAANGFVGMICRI